MFGTSLNTTGNPPGGGGLRSGVALAQIVLDAAQFAEGVNIIIRDSRTMTQRIEADTRNVDKAIGGIEASYRRAGAAAQAAGRQMQQATQIDAKSGEQSIRALERAYQDTAKAAEQAAQASKRIEREGLNSASRLAESLQRADPEGFSRRRNEAFSRGLADEARRALERLDAQEALLGPQGSASPVVQSAGDLGARAGSQYSQQYLAQVKNLDDQVANILRSQRPNSGLFGGAQQAQANITNARVDLGPLGVDQNAIRARSAAFNQGINEANTRIERIRNQLDDAGDAARYGLGDGLRDAALAATALYAAFAVRGIGIANEIKRTELLFTTLSGSEEQAAENMDALREMADKTRQPVLGLVDAANQILPALRGGNASLDETVSLMQRLSILDPQQGLQGASIALREFLSGETTSLQRRFELERSRLTDILRSSGGNQRRAIRELTDYIEERTGLTEEAMQELGASGYFAFERLSDAGRRLMDIVFRPLLNNLVLPLIDAFSNLVNIINSIDSATVNSLVTAVTGIGLVRGLDRLRSAGFISDRTAGIGSRAVTTVAAGEVGIEAGLGIARWLTSRPGIQGAWGVSDLGDQENARRVIGDTFKQAVVVLFSGIGSLVEVFMRGSDLLENIFEQIGNVLQLAGLNLNLAFEQLDKGIGEFIEQLGRDLGNTDIEGLGRSIRTSAEEQIGRRTPTSNTSGSLGLQGSGLLGQIEQIERRLSEGIGPTAEQEQAIDSFWDWWNTNVVLPVTEATGLMPEAAANTYSFVDSLRSLVTATADELLAWEDYQDELADINAKARQDTIDENTRFVNQVHQINRQWEQGLIEGLEDLGVESARAIGIVTRGTFQQVIDATAAAIRNNIRTELGEDINDVRAKTAAQNDEDAIKSERRIAELREKSNDDLIKLEEDRARQLQELWEDFMLAMDEAIAARDVTAAIRARRQFNDQRGDLEEDYQVNVSERRQQLNDEIAEQREALAIQRADREKEANAEIQRLRDQAAKQETEEIAQATRQLERQEKAHQDQLTELNTQHIDRLNAITKQADTEAKALADTFLGVLRDNQAQANVIGEGLRKANDFWAAAISSAAINQFAAQHGIYRGIAQASTDTTIAYAKQAANVLASLGAQVASYVNHQIKASPSYVLPTYTSPTQRNVGKGITAFNTGTGPGGVPATGIYHLDEREKVLNQAYSSAIDNLFGRPVGQADIYNALAGGGSMQMVVNNQFNDVGSHSIPELSSMVYDVMVRVAAQAGRNIGAPIRGS